jgi:translation initiation factor 1
MLTVIFRFVDPLKMLTEFSKSLREIQMRLFAGTQFDRPPLCERCGKLTTDCSCPPQPKPPSKQIARIRLEKRGKGKSVTTIRDLDDCGPHLTELLTKLKNHCGAGGTIQEGIIEVQGDQMVRITQFLQDQGYRTR